ncbi:MAG: glycosyltransferase family 39 protein [Chitinophagales bacterium]|nr:glycosyltransferase family 39 protein [Chitinophagales bacterium]
MNKAINSTVKQQNAASSRAEFKLRYPLIWLTLSVIIVYASTINFGFTELDDSIFIRDFQEYNQNITNLFTSFHRGVFDPIQDTYYRPLFLDSIILNYQISGQQIAPYHVLNILFHLITVLLLFVLLQKIKLNRLHSFILALFFAVHPVLSQAVAWIPGRNDTMLGIFVVAFLVFTINYFLRRKPGNLLLSFFFLLGAFFTKETAIFAPPVAFILLLYLNKKKWLSNENIFQYATWLLAFFIWYKVRSEATIKESGLQSSIAFAELFNRLPVIIQYTGKIFLPFNLSVFPILVDTVNYYGFISIALASIAIYFSRKRDWGIILAGISVFLLFLIPALLVPNTLNDQTFEHRLYLPIIGMLMVLSQTALFQNIRKEKHLLAGSIMVILLFAFLNYRHQQSFKDPVSFWAQAVKTSPHSAYATMMLGARIDNDRKDKTESGILIRKAYSLNPKEKYVNFYYGQMLQNEDSVLSSEKFFLEEKRISDYYECDFYLARVAFEKKDLELATNLLENYLSKDPSNEQANNNLLLLYLETGKNEKAKDQGKRIQELGFPVTPEILQRLEKL